MSHGNPQTQVVVTITWIVVVAGGGAGVAAIIIEGAAPHDAVGSTDPYNLWLHPNCSKKCTS